MKYHIISGRTVETRLCWMSARSVQEGPRHRAKRVAGKSSLRKIVRNEQEKVKRLTRIINCNFGMGDMWITLKYSDDRLPEDIDKANKDADKLLAALRKAYNQETGKKLRYIHTISRTNPRTGDTARFHHHLVMDRLAYEILIRIWPAEQISYRILDNRGDHTALAKYIIDNGDDTPGKKKWRTSKGLLKPIYTEPEPAEAIESIKAPAGVDVRENVLICDEESGIFSAYMRYVAENKPTVRKNRVYLNPRKRKRGDENGF